MPFHVPAYDWIFLAVGGVGFSLIGLILARGTRERPAARMTKRGDGSNGGTPTDEPVSAPFAASVGSIDDFLTDRHCLFTTIAEAAPAVWRFTIGRGPAAGTRDDHDRYGGRSESSDDQWLTPAPALARRQDVVAWAPTRLSDRDHRSVRNVTE